MRYSIFWLLSGRRIRLLLYY